MSEAAVVIAFARLVRLEERVVAAEGDGLRARWEFGHELLRARDGKGRLPNGYLTRVAEETGASRRELSYRIQFAEKCPTEDELRNALQSCGSWFSVVSEFLPSRKVPSAGLVIAPEGTFSTIVADPPWQYDNKATRGAAEDHYPTLSIEELCALPVKEWAAEQAHLYLWTTNGFLRESFDVLDAWGFTYKTTLVWVKPQIGMGNYFRSSSEYVLFGVRGGLRTKDCNQRNWFEAPRGQHSAKPDRFFDLVERASYAPGLEMFARRRRDNLLSDFTWDYWGNEA